MPHIIKSRPSRLQLISPLSFVYLYCKIAACFLADRSSNALNIVDLVALLIPLPSLQRVDCYIVDAEAAAIAYASLHISCAQATSWSKCTNLCTCCVVHSILARLASSASSKTVATGWVTIAAVGGRSGKAARSTE